MADRFRIGGTGVYNDTAKWSATSGGAGGASVPGSSDNALWDSNSGGGTCTLDVAVAVIDFDMRSGNTQAVDTDSGSNFAVTTSGDFLLTAGGFTANASTITSGGNVIIASGSGLFVRGTSTFIINGTGNLSNPSGGHRFFNLTFSGAITTTLISDFDVENTFTTGTGTIQDDGVTQRTITLKSSMVNQGPTWNPTGMTMRLVFDSSSPQTIPADDYTTNMAIKAFGTGLVSLGGNVTCGLIIVSATNALARMDMVTFNLTCTEVIIGAGTSTTNGQLDCGSGILDCSGDIFISDSDFGVTGRDNKILGESATIKLGDDWTVESVTDAGIFTKGTSTLICTGGSLQRIISGGSAFHNFKSENGTGRINFDDAVDIDNELQANAISTDIDYQFNITVTHNINALRFFGVGSNHITMKSMTPATQYNIALGLHSRARHLDVTDANVTGNHIDASCKNSIDGGNNSSNIRFIPHLQIPDNKLVSVPDYDLVSEPAIANCA